MSVTIYKGERHGNHDLQIHLTAVAVLRDRRLVQALERPAQMFDCLEVGRARHRHPRRGQPVHFRLPEAARQHEMVGQKLRLALGGFGKVVLEHLGDSAVPFDARGAQHGLICGFLHERMAESARRLLTDATGQNLLIETKNAPALRMAMREGVKQWTTLPPDMLRWLDKGTSEEFAVTGDFPVDIIKVEFLTKPKPDKR